MHSNGSSSMEMNNRSFNETFNKDILNSTDLQNKQVLYKKIFAILHQCGHDNMEKQFKEISSDSYIPILMIFIYRKCSPVV